MPIALAAAGQLASDGVSAEVIDLRCLIPLDMATVLASVARTSRLLIVEENPYQGGWGATIASIAADEGFELLDAPIRRVAAECVPLPFADALEDQVIPTTAESHRRHPRPARLLRNARYAGSRRGRIRPRLTSTGKRPITDEGVAVGGAFDSDTATGMMPVAHRVAGVLASWRS